MLSAKGVNAAILNRRYHVQFECPLATLRFLVLPALFVSILAPFQASALPVYFNETEDDDLELVYDVNAGGIQFDQFRSFELTEGVSRFEGAYSLNQGYGYASFSYFNK